MQFVQTFIRWAPPFGSCTLIDCRFGLNRRGVRLFACETLFPNWGPLPQTSQRLAIILNLQGLLNPIIAESYCSQFERDQKPRFITNGFPHRQGVTISPVLVRFLKELIESAQICESNRYIHTSSAGRDWARSVQFGRRLRRQRQFGSRDS